MAFFFMQPVNNTEMLHLKVMKDYSFNTFSKSRLEKWKCQNILCFVVVFCCRPQTNCLNCLWSPQWPWHKINNHFENIYSFFLHSLKWKNVPQTELINLFLSFFFSLEQTESGSKVSCRKGCTPSLLCQITISQLFQIWSLETDPTHFLWIINQ